VNAKRLLPIFLIVLVDVFGLTLVIPLLGIYAERFHATPLQATLLVSVFAACQLIAGPLLGRLSDRFGRKPMLIISQVGTFAGFVVLASARALWMIFLSRIIDGVTAGNLTIAQAYISDHTKPENRSRAFAVIGVAFGIGFFIGPFLTGSLVRYGFTAPIWLAAAMSFTSIMATTFLLPGGKPPQREGEESGPGGKRLAIVEWGSYGAYFTRPVLGGLLLQFFFFAFAFSFFTSGFALYAERVYTWHGEPFGPREIGYLFAYVGLLGIILQGGLIARLVARFGEPRLIATAFAAMVIGYIGLSLSGSITVLVVLATFTAYGTALARPLLSSLVSQKAERHEQGLVLGLVQSMNSIAQIAAPSISGLVIEHRWLREWSWLPAASALMGVVATRWGSSRVERTRRQPPV
jgi:MFS family permease